jgi:hypothetical protein
LTSATKASHLTEAFSRTIPDHLDYEVPCTPFKSAGGARLAEILDAIWP